MYNAQPYFSLKNLGKKYALCMANSIVAGIYLMSSLAGANQSPLYDDTIYNTKPETHCSDKWALLMCL